MTDIPEYERGRADEFSDVVTELEDIVARSHDSQRSRREIVKKAEALKESDHAKAKAWLEAIE